MDEEKQTERVVHAGYPTKRHQRGPQPTIRGCGTKEKDKDRHEPRLFPNQAKVTEDLKRRMLVKAMRMVLNRLLETHI